MSRIMDDDFREIITIGIRRFEVHYVYRTGWKLIDLVTGSEIRSVESNGLYPTRQAAKDSACNYYERLYGQSTNNPTQW